MVSSSCKQASGIFKYPSILVSYIEAEQQGKKQLIFQKLFPQAAMKLLKMLS